MSENTVNYPFLILGIISSFLVINLLVGWFSKRNIKTLDNYALANKSLGVGPLMITLLVTTIGTWYMMSKVSDVWENGITITFVQSSGYIILTLVLNWIVFSRLVHLQGCYTLGDIMSRIYGPHARLLTGLLTALFSIFVITSQLIAIGELSDYLAISKSHLIIGIGMGITCYTWLGGIRAITATDIFSFTFIIIGLAFITNLVIQKVVGGGMEGAWNIFSETSSVAIKSEGTSFSIWNKLFMGKYPMLGVVVASTFFLAIYPIVFMTPPVIQRILMTQGKSQLKHILAGLAIFYPLFRLLIFMLGLGILLTTQDNSLKEVDILGRLMSKDFFGENLLICLLLMLIFVGITISIVGSFLNALAILFVRDIVQPIIGSKVSAMNEVRWIRHSTLLSGGVCMCLALIVQKSLPVSLIVLASISLSSICIPFLAGILGLKGDYRSFFWSTFVFIFISITLLFLGQENFFGLGETVCLQRKYYSLFLFPLLISTGVLLFMHYIKNGGFRVECCQKTCQCFWYLKAKSWWTKLINPTDQIGTGFYTYRSQSTFLGLFFCAVYLVPYLGTADNNTAYIYFLFILSSIGSLLCVGLLLLCFWKKHRTKYFSLYALFVALYCIPFTHTLLFLCRLSSPLVLMQCIITSLLLVSLVEWSIFISLTIIGSVLGVAVYSLLPNGIVEPISPLLLQGPIYCCMVVFLWVIGVGSMLVLNYQKSQTVQKKLTQYQLLVVAFVHQLKHILHDIPGLDLNELIHKRIGRQSSTEQDKISVNLKNYKELIILGAAIERELTHAQEVMSVFKNLAQNSLMTSQDMVVRDIRNIMNACWQKLTIEKRDRVILPPESDDFDIKLHPPLFFHVVYNLVNNAFKHGKCTEVNIYWEKSTRRLYIKDNGQGIDKEVLPHIFCGGYIDKKPKGVGLSFVKMILEDIGATIEVVSTGKQGTLFAINFPIIKKVVERKLVSSSKNMLM